MGVRGYKNFRRLKVKFRRTRDFYLRVRDSVGLNCNSVEKEINSVVSVNHPVQKEDLSVRFTILFRLSRDYSSVSSFISVSACDLFRLSCTFF